MSAPVVFDVDDGDIDMRPPDASELGGKQLAEELERRGLKPTGFLEDDARLLQKAFDAEFEMERAERIKQRAEMLARKRAEEEALKLQRFLERQKHEEEEAIASDKRAAFWLDLLRENRTPPDMIIRVNPVAVRALVKVLAPNRSLLSLDLSSCALRDDVGIELGRALGSNTYLRSLDLDFNLFGPKAAVALAEGLSTNTSLRSLSLERNPLTGDACRDTSGVQAIANMLRRNTTLVNLNLFQCGLKRTGGRILAAAVASNSTLVALQLSPSDEMDVEDLSLITDTLRTNIQLAEQAKARGKEERAAARAAAKAAAERAAEDAALAAEQAWVEMQKQVRARAREEAEMKELDRLRKEAAEREVTEKERRERLAAEAEAKAKKAAKAVAKKK